MCYWAGHLWARGAQSYWDPLRDYGECASEATTDLRGEGRVCPTPFPNSQGLPMGVVFFYVLGRTRMSIEWVPKDLQLWSVREDLGQRARQRRCWKLVPVQSWCSSNGWSEGRARGLEAGHKRCLRQAIPHHYFCSILRRLSVVSSHEPCPLQSPRELMQVG